MDPIFQATEKLLKMSRNQIPMGTVHPMLIIYKSGENYSSKAVLDTELKFMVLQDIVQKQIDEIQIINIGKLMNKVDTAVSSMRKRLVQWGQG